MTCTEGLLQGQPLITIVLPTYNRSSRLPGAITSCLNQTYRNLEVIVVDDGSTDQTPLVVAEIAQRDPRVRYLRQENQRIPGALNTGFAASRGAYLTWTSDDNRFHTDALEIMLRALLEHPEVGLVYCDCDVVDGNGSFLRRMGVEGPEYLLRANCVAACFMYRRQVYESIGNYDPNWLLVEDYEYWLRVQQKFKLFRIPNVAPYDYASHDESLTSKRRLQQGLKDMRLRMRFSSGWIRKLAILRSASCSLSESAAAQQKWSYAIFFAFLFALGEPWRRWKWRILLARLRGALQTPKLGTAARPRSS